jgi:uncharacterized protein with HEPN domain
MTRHDPRLAIEQMIAYAREAEAVASGFTAETLAADRLRSLALVRLVELVGEASTRVPAGIRELHPDVPWRELKDTRNRLIHGYDGVDLAITLEICHRDLPKLRIALGDSA